jgi:hypothetical protein
LTILILCSREEAYPIRDPPILHEVPESRLITIEIQQLEGLFQMFDESRAAARPLANRCEWLKKSFNNKERPQLAGGEKGEP